MLLDTIAQAHVAYRGVLASTGYIVVGIHADECIEYCVHVLVHLI